MAEKSIFWTTGATGDGASSYTQAEVIRWMRQMMVGDDTDEGVHKGYEDELEVTDHGDGTVDVASGAGIVYGFPYWNTAAVNVNIPTPVAATRIDRVVLQADWTAQEVRITRVAGIEGGGAPSLTQTDGVTWEISLAQVSKTTGGVISITDEREWVRPNIGVDENMLDASVAGNGLDGGDGDALEVNVDDSTIEINADALRVKNDGIDDTKVGNRVPQFYRRQGGDASDWTVPGSTNRTPTTVRMQAGAITLSFSGALTATQVVTFPTAFSDYPLVWVSQGEGSNPGGSVAITLESFNVGTGGFTIQGFSDGVITDAVIVNWLAIGPE